jgi:hypothetical protein
VVAVGISPRLRGELSQLAGGRALIVDYFVTARCGSVVGDITADFGREPQPDSYARLEDVEGVRVYAELRLLPLLEEAGPRLDRRRVPFGPQVGLRLDRPEQWLGFLERPGVMVGKRPWDGWRHRSS